MDLAYIGYLLFVFPGFCFVWTYRHFSKASKISDFEWAAWSFLFGTALFFLTMLFASISNAKLPAIPLNDPAAEIGGFLGTGLAIATGLAFPLGFICAGISKSGAFKEIDTTLSRLLEWLTRK